MGNTDELDGLFRYNKDHPHIHGEHRHEATLRQSFLGSPPHTWGTLLNKATSSFVAGITPTYMGNTDTDTETSSETKDHPHIHGEH